MLLELSSQQVVLLLESLSRDVDRLHQKGTPEVVILEDIMLKCRMMIVDNLLLQTRSTKEQVNKYIKSQMVKIAAITNDDMAVPVNSKQDVFENVF